MAIDGFILKKVLVSLQKCIELWMHEKSERKSVKWQKKGRTNEEKKEKWKSNETNPM